MSEKMINSKKNKNNNILLYIIVAVVLVTLIIVALLTSFAVKGEKINLYSCYILVISLLTLGATIMMSVVIYRLGIIRENQKQVNNMNKAKAAILQSLKRTLNFIILYYADYNEDLVNEDLSYFFDSFSSEISLSLSDKNFQTLFKLVKKLKSFNDDVAYDGWFDASCEFSFVFKNWIGLLYCTNYRQYFSLVQNEYEVFSKEIIDLLSELSGKNMEFNDCCDVMSVEGDVLLSYNKCTKYITVKNLGEIILNAELDFDIYDKVRIKNGFEMSEKHDLYYKAFKRVDKF